MTNISKLLSEPLYILLISYLVPLRSHPPSPDPLFMCFGVGFNPFFPVSKEVSWRRFWVLGSAYCYGNDLLGRGTHRVFFFSVVLFGYNGGCVKHSTFKERDKVMRL